MYRIKNTTDDRTKALLHRTANKFEYEPNLGGVRIRLGTYLDITEEHYERVKPLVDEWVKKGMVDVSKVGTSTAISTDPEYDGNGLRLDGPIIEDWLKAGYQAETYPPTGYAEIPSIGLTTYRLEQEKIRRDAANYSAEVIRQSLEAPVVTTEIPVVPVQPPTVIIEPAPALAPTVLASSPPPVAAKIDPNKNQKKFR